MGWIEPASIALVWLCLLIAISTVCTGLVREVTGSPKRSSVFSFRRKPEQTTDETVAVPEQFAGTAAAAYREGWTDVLERAGKYPLRGVGQFSADEWNGYMSGRAAAIDEHDRREIVMQARADQLADEQRKREAYRDALAELRGDDEQISAAEAAQLVAGAECKQLASEYAHALFGEPISDEQYRLLRNGADPLGVMPIPGWELSESNGRTLYVHTFSGQVFTLPQLRHAMFNGGLT